jgi:hypothetical protein
MRRAMPDPFATLPCPGGFDLPEGDGRIIAAASHDIAARRGCRDSPATS